MFQESLSRTEKRDLYENSIIPKELVGELQELFNEAIPRLMERIQNEKVTHILLTEKTARLFKVGLRKVLDILMMDDVKIGKFAPDYFLVEGKVAEEQKKKLKFIKDDLKRDDLKIMILDEYTESGDTLNNSRYELEELFGLQDDQVITDYIQKVNPDNQIIVEAVYDNTGEIFSDEVEYAKLKNKEIMKKYKDTVQQIADMMVEAVDDL